MSANTSTPTPSGLNDATLTTDPSKEYLTISFNSIRPFSRGRVHISSSNASQLPDIDVNFLGFDSFGDYFLPNYS